MNKIIQKLYDQERSLSIQIQDEIKQYTFQDIIQNVELYAYQIHGVQWLLLKYAQQLNAILGDEMGLGKTIQVITMIGKLLFHYNQNQIGRCMVDVPIGSRFLIIAPLSVVSNWSDQFQSFSPSVPTRLYIGSKEDRKVMQGNIQLLNEVVLITSYETILSDADFLCNIQWDLMIFDEGHRLKNMKGKLYNVLMHQFHPRHKLLLTGTPIQNNLQELYALLSFLNPQYFQDPIMFEDAFKGTFSLSAQQIFLNDNEKMKISQNQQQGQLLMKQLLKPVLLLRTIQDVKEAFALPSLSEIVVHTSLSPMQRHYYREIVAKNAAAINDAIGHRGVKVSLLNILPQLRKACNHPYLFPGAEPEPFMEGPHLYENSGKMMILHQILPKLRENGHIVLIFSVSAQFLDILQDYLTFEQFAYERIDGSVRGKERWQAIDRFHNNPETFVFLISTRSGGVGLNLQRADTVIFMDSDFNPQADLQAVARAYRLGQTKPIHVIKLLCANTVEEIIYRRSIRKMKMAKTIQNCARSTTPLSRSAEDDDEVDNDVVNLIQFGLHKILSMNDDEKVEMLDDDYIQYILTRRSSDENNEDKYSTMHNINDDLNEVGGDFQDENMHYFEGEDYSKVKSNTDDSESLVALCQDAMGSTSTRRPGSKVNQRRQYAVYESDSNEDNDNDMLSESENGLDEEERKRRREEKRLEKEEERRIRRDKAIQQQKLLWAQNGYYSRVLPMETNDTEPDAVPVPLRFKAGDASNPPNSGNLLIKPIVIVHCVDNSGIWSKRGFFRALSSRYPDVAKQYELASLSGDMKLGKAHLIPVEANVFVCLLVVQGFNGKKLTQKRQKLATGKYRTGSSTTIRIKALESALCALATKCILLQASIHMPRIGYGTPNFNWYTVERIIRKNLCDRGIDVSVYYYSNEQSTV